MANRNQLTIFDVMDYAASIHVPIDDFSQMGRLIYAANSMGHGDMMEMLYEWTEHIDVLIAQEFCDEHEPSYDEQGWTCKRCFHAEVFFEED